MPAFYYSIGARYYKCERFTITMEVYCMKTQRRTADEQYQLIMECRSSGLSDYQWCTEHNINPGTFYNWVKRLRKKACYDIPGDYQKLACSNFQSKYFCLNTRYFLALTIAVSLLTIVISSLS